MTSKRQRQRIHSLAHMCIKAYRKNPELWFDEFGDVYFDFPEYGGLPVRTANSLSSDTVDVIQGFLWDVHNGSMKLNVSSLKRILNDYADSGYSIRK